MGRPSIPVNKGDIFGKLVVIKELPSCIGEPRLIDCKCECGMLITCKFTDISRGRRTSCGCDKRAEIPIRKGNKYGSLVVIKEVTTRDHIQACFTQPLECLERY